MFTPLEAGWFSFFFFKQKSQSTRRQVACLDGYINNQTVTRAAALFSPSITSSSPPPNANDIFLFYPLCLSLTRVSWKLKGRTERPLIIYSKTRNGTRGNGGIAKTGALAQFAICLPICYCDYLHPNCCLYTYSLFALFEPLATWLPNAHSQETEECSLPTYICSSSFFFIPDLLHSGYSPPSCHAEHTEWQLFLSDTRG